MDVGGPPYPDSDVTRAGRSPKRSLRFTRQQRIRKRPEFQQVFERGSRLHSRYFTLLVLPNSGTTSRLGIVASRKIGGAVQRNRSKRLIREMFRQQPQLPAGGIDAVVIPRREVAEAPFAELSQDFSSLWRRGRERVLAARMPRT